MKERRFTLPGIHELTKEQEDALALDKVGQHLIIGGPGTGKSVVALLRSRRHHQDKDKYRFLVYNHLLRQASNHLFGTNFKGKTWNLWFSQIFQYVTNQPVPYIPLEPGHNWQEIDWQRAIQIIKEAPTANNLPFLIIDEGQDMPPQFYEALTEVGFMNFYVVADQNQQITRENSSRQDIEIKLSINTHDVIELKENFRNSYSTARLAREFYTGDPAAPPPNLPPVERSAKQPILVEYGENHRYTFDIIITRILKTADRDPRKLIGIITPNNNIREIYVNALQNNNTELDNPKPEIQTYHAGGNLNLSFGEGGIMVINSQSCKGLEFDIVFLADVDKYYYYHQISDDVKKKFYVMVARSRENVIMLKNAENRCPVEAILPTDEAILGRWR